LREHGPLWITADEDPSAKFSVHARVLIGLRGDGTPDGTIATFLGTVLNAPSPSSETVATLQRNLSQLASHSEGQVLQSHT
jgi:papain like cysteine protease AvrRpt2